MRRGHRYESLVEMFKDRLDEPLVGVEIGVWEGKMSEKLLEAMPNLKLYLVDTWSPPEKVDSYFWSDAKTPHYPVERYQKAYEGTLKRIEPYKDRVEILRMKTTVAAAYFEDESIDFGFVDADHSYIGCKNDIIAWYPKVKYGGYICGHDYAHPKQQGEVKKAVLEFYDEKDVITGHDTTWFVKKLRQPDDKIVILSVYFKDSTGMYEELRRVFEYSLKKNMPKAELRMIEIAPPSPGCLDFSDQLYKHRVWTEESNKLACNHILMDCDLIVLKDLSEAFKEDFDIGYTGRDVIERPLNGGVVFVKPSEGSKKFMSRWLELCEEFYADPDYRMRYNKYRGFAQAALGKILFEEEVRCRYKQFHCKEWNACDDEWADYEEDTAKILHIKKQLRKSLFGNRLPEQDKLKPIKTYNKYRDMIAARKNHGKKIEDNVTVVIRGAKERTEGLCRYLIEQQIDSKNVFLVNKIPSTEGTRAVYEIGMKEGRKWTLFVDADLLLKKDAIERLYALAESADNKAFGIKGSIKDKLLMEVRGINGGAIMYRTEAFKEAINFIPKPKEAIRPDSHIIKQMKALGWGWERHEECMALHDFEQFNKDIHRKSFYNGIKIWRKADQLVGRWKELAKKDRDYFYCLNGYELGRKHEGNVDIDVNINHGYFGIEEKKVIAKYSNFKDIYEETIKKWDWN